MADELRPTYSPADSSPWRWLQVPAISIGAEVNVVGESYYQDALEAVAGGRNPFGTRIRLLTVILARESDNPYDANAVRVEAGGATLAHLSRDDAPRFHALLDRLAHKGVPATCRAVLTGGWDRGNGDRGTIGIKILTGRRPKEWTGNGAFLPAVPWHEQHTVALDSVGPWAAGLIPRPVVTLVDTGQGNIALFAADVCIGQIHGRPDLAAFADRVKMAGLPSTAQAQIAGGQLTVDVIDPDAVMVALDRFGTADLYTVRHSIRPTGWWICQRCHLIWNDNRQPPERWYEITDENSGSPHICRQCWSYRFTHPI
jgi:hypothetical protein